METVTEMLMAKLRDYHRFLGTLIVVGVYFYIGSLIQIYIRHEAGGGKYALLSVGCAVVGFLFTLKINQIKQKIEEEGA